MLISRALLQCHSSIIIICSPMNSPCNAKQSDTVLAPTASGQAWKKEDGVDDDDGVLNKEETPVSSWRDKMRQ